MDLGSTFWALTLPKTKDARLNNAPLNTEFGSARCADGEQTMTQYPGKLISGLMALVVAFFIVPNGANADVPDELYAALGVGKDASPKELYDALTKRYYDS